MKRKCLVIIFLVLSELLFGYTAHTIKSFTLQAGYDEAADITITPIAAQAQTYLAGMPFDIESQQVWYGYTEHGREIAKWSILSNTDFDLKITTDKLFPVNEDGSIREGYEGLDYILEFQYILGYMTDAGVASIESSIICDSKDGETIVEDLAAGFIKGSEGSPYFIGGVDGSIFFYFDSDSTALIKNAVGNPNDASVPAGTYQATVTVSMESKS